MSEVDDRPRHAVRLRLGIAYDGTSFAGWARQPGQRTVAGELSAALHTLMRTPVPLVVAGRTDAGVHAVGQVAHIDVDRDALVSVTPRHLSDESTSPIVTGAIGLRRRLAGLLPADVRVYRADPAPDGFHARFSALRRHYVYRVLPTEWGVPPLMRFDTVAWRRPLDPEAMREAGGLLLGLHDFAAYCKRRDGATTIRELQALTVAERPLPGDNGWPEVDGPGVIEIRVTADAFCHSMVRALVGALLAVGEGRCESDRPRELLRARERTSEIAVAPARGLTLQSVDYPEASHLAERAAMTRALREVRDVER